MRNVLGMAFLASVPLCCLAYPFACGFFNLSQVYLMVLAPAMLFGPPLATAAAAPFLRIGPAWRHVALCLALYVLVIAGFFLAPPGAAGWTIGFAANLKMTKHPDQIQKWATGVLARYESGTLATIPKAEYWAIGKERLAEAEVPARIRNLWWKKPSTGIATMTDEGRLLDPARTNTTSLTATGTPSTRGHCVAFSWCLTGVLVGPPDFRPTWNPWYIRRIIPGVYAYCGMK